MQTDTSRMIPYLPPTDLHRKGHWVQRSRSGKQTGTGCFLATCVLVPSCNQGVVYTGCPFTSTKPRGKHSAATFASVSSTMLLLDCKLLALPVHGQTKTFTPLLALRSDSQTKPPRSLPRWDLEQTCNCLHLNINNPKYMLAPHILIDEKFVSKRKKSMFFQNLSH